jgi:DNA repair photolyase
MISTKQLKNISIKYSGRSSDYIFPTVVQGCVGGCHYCYAARHSPMSFYGNVMISENLDAIIDTVHKFTPKVSKPNQTHEKYTTWDIACNADIVPVLEEFDWKYLFNYFKNSNRDFATLATKFVNKKLLDYKPDKKIRVRMSLMPENYSNVIEPKTSLVRKRIAFINELYDAGYEVHVNFSPVIYTNTWKEDYKKLFTELDSAISDNVKHDLKCEVIFLTHNEQLHKFNVSQQKKGESALWVPKIQENKTSKFGGNNVRYYHKLKSTLVEEFKELVQEIIPYCEIRYIF